ncbi:MAG: ligase-associated DNA damage response DEXH box helicase [Legionella sp.]|nr:ligase-associated DNA damage response DEXH box helicase [Legionella sp.]
MVIPSYLLAWFTQKRWRLHSYQKAMFKQFGKRASTLLIAPTGGGKTLASFLPSLVDLQATPRKGLHTLYISPLKALTNDIQNNLLDPIKQMGLNIEVAVRTGDTSSYQRLRQRNNPPHLLLTTPESLMLLLSYSSAQDFFKSLNVIIVDEIHSFAATKRGDLLSLALAQVNTFAPDALRIGLSATIGNPQLLAAWLANDKQKVDVIEKIGQKKPTIKTLVKKPIPYGGFLARYAIDDLYKTIRRHKLSLIFVNTRAQAEFIFQSLWQVNTANERIGLYHGSLEKEQRIKVEKAMSLGQLKAVITTSALELGIDWDHVDFVIQVGAPHGINRLIQRIGRSNHRLSARSHAGFVPANCFEALECEAFIQAIEKGQFDNEPLKPGSLDVVIQFIMNAACSEAVTMSRLYQIVRKAWPYQHLTKKTFGQLFQFAVNGGYTLKHYQQYHRLVSLDSKHYIVANTKVMRRHRQNIGTIIEAARLRVKILNRRKDKIVGEVEESFAQQLVQGETFVFAGEILEFIRIRDLYLEVKKSTRTQAQLPSYAGGTLPLTRSLATEVSHLINNPHAWKRLPENVQEWLVFQKKLSHLPKEGQLLIEQFIYRKNHYLVIHNFIGKQANYTLGMLVTRHLEKQHLKPRSFTVTDYGLAINSQRKLKQEEINTLLTINCVEEELNDWLKDSSLLKRTFREIAIISGLIERQSAGKRKTMKQVTFSTDLIYDALHRYEPNHILLAITAEEVQKHFLAIDRVMALLKNIQQQVTIIALPHPSPFAIPLLTAFTTERLKGEAVEEILSLEELDAEANALMRETKNIVE